MPFEKMDAKSIGWGKLPGIGRRLPGPIHDKLESQVVSNLPGDETSPSSRQAWKKSRRSGTGSGAGRVAARDPGLTERQPAVVGRRPTSFEQVKTGSRQPVAQGVEQYRVHRAAPADGDF